MSAAGLIPERPALETLVKAFNRWQKEEPYLTEQNHAREVTQAAVRNLGVEREEVARLPDPSGIALIKSLPSLSAASLPPIDRYCGICTRPYHDKGDYGGECVPTQLPCSHVVGNNCIVSWLNPVTGNNNSCPYCRRQLFPKMPDIDTIEGLQARVEFYDWTVQLIGVVNRPELKQKIRAWTRLIVADRIEEARIELYVQSQAVTRSLDASRKDYLESQSVRTEGNGVADPESSLAVTAESARPLVELRLRGDVIESFELQVRVSHLEEENAELRAQQATLEEVLHRMEREVEGMDVEMRGRREEAGDA